MEKQQHGGTCVSSFRKINSEKKMEHFNPMLESSDDEAPDEVTFEDSKASVLLSKKHALETNRREKDLLKEKRRKRHELFQVQKKRRLLPAVILEEIDQPRNQIDEKKNGEGGDEGSGEEEETETNTEKEGNKPDVRRVKDKPSTSFQSQQQAAMDFIQSRLYGQQSGRTTMNKFLSTTHKTSLNKGPAVQFLTTKKLASNGKKRKAIGKQDWDAESISAHSKGSDTQYPLNETQTPQTRPKAPQPQRQAPQTRPQDPETRPQAPQPQPQALQPQPQAPQPQAPQPQPQSPQPQPQSPQPQTPQPQPQSPQPQPQTLQPHPQTPQPQPQTPQPQPQTPQPQPQTPQPQPQTPQPQPQTPQPQPQTPQPQPQTPQPQPQTPQPQPQTPQPQPQTPQPQLHDPQPHPQNPKIQPQDPKPRAPEPGTPCLPWHRKTPKIEAEPEFSLYQMGVVAALGTKPDDEELFLMSLVGVLRRLPPRKRAEVKIKFQQVLLEAEFDD